MQLALECCSHLGLAAPVEWAQEPPASPTTLIARRALEEDSLLEDTFSLGLSPSSSPALSEAPDHFPCIADELEEQAKQLEEDWLCCSQPATGSPRAPPAPQPSPTRVARAQLLEGVMERVQQQLERVAELRDAEERAATRTPPPQEEAAAEAACYTASAGATASAGGEPCTPQRHSANDSSWNESPLPGGLEYGEVQSPAPASLLALPSVPVPSAARPVPSAARRVPLQLAIDNAQRVRLGQDAAPGAWAGCGRSAWCCREAHHCGDCNASAVVPGLLAYPSHELFESGVNIEELCRVPEDLAAQLAPDTESEEGEGPGATRTAADCLSSGKRPRGDECGDDGSSHSQSGAGCGGTASTGSAGVEEPASPGSAAKRLRTDASSAAAGLGAAAEMALALAAAALDPAPAADLVCSATAWAGDATPCPRMVPVEVPQQPQMVPTPAKVPQPQFAPPVPSLASAVSRNRGRPAGAPRLRPLPPPPPPAPAPPPQPVAHVPSKPVTRQKHQPHPSSAAPAAPRSSGRKVVLQWHTESVVDPRSGATVTHVLPGTFCTQCYALSTPVWRAGPFGHKTLCNACGVRWMKASKGSKK